VQALFPKKRDDAKPSSREGHNKLVQIQHLKENRLILPPELTATSHIVMVFSRDGLI